MPRLRLLLASTSPLALLLSVLPVSILPAAAQTAPAQTPPAQTAPVELPPVSVEGGGSAAAPVTDYKSDAVSLPKVTAPLRDTAKTIEIIPRQVMDDQGVTNFRDAVRNVPGVSVAAGEAGAQGDTLTIRGFNARNDIYIDGMRDFGSYFRDPFYIDSIEVLKGPDSILFGKGSTGGVVNQTSKTPSLNPFTAGTLQFGTDGTKRTTFDYNTPLPSLGTGAALRLNVMGNDSDVADRKVTENSRFGFAPSLVFGLGTDTRYTFTYLHQSEYDIPDYGVPWFPEAAGNTGTHFSEPARVSRDNYYGFTHGNFIRTNVDVATAKYEHEFNDSVSIRNQARYAHYVREFRITEPQIDNPGTTTFALIPPGTSLNTLNVTRNQLAGTSLETYLGNQTDLTAKVKTWGIEHTFVTGVEIDRETSGPRRLTARAGSVPSTTSLLSPTPDDVFNSVLVPNTSTDVAATTLAAYGLDTLKFNEHWSLTGGVRFDNFDARSALTTFNNPAGTVASRTNIHHIDNLPSWRTALVYKPAPNGSIYIDYGTSFDPSAENISIAANAAALAPESSSTTEIGTKWDLLQEKLSLTVAAFHSNKENAKEPNPLDSTTQILAGNAIAKGFEVGLTGRITEKWQVIAGYAYTFSKITNPEQGVGGSTVVTDTGQRLANTPLHTANIWTTYVTPWKVQVGGGIDYIGSRNATTTPRVVGTDTFIEKAPGYWTANLMASYPLNDHVTAQVNVNNLFDKFYYDQLHPSHVIPGAGRSAMFTINVKY